MYKRPFNNKSNFDPGRFIHTIIFCQQASTAKPSGGTTVQLVPVKTVRAVKLQVRDGNQLEINAGASQMNEDAYFIVRFMKDFQPKKDMTVKEGGEEYTLRAIIPVDETTHYIKLLCIKNG